MPCKECGTKKPNKALFCSTCGLRFKTLHDDSLEEKEIMYLVRRGADPNELDKKGRTPLMVIIDEWWDEDTVSRIHKLLGLGADPNLCDKKGNTPLMLIDDPTYRSKEIFMEILNALCPITDVIVHNNEGKTFLMRVIESMYDPSKEDEEVEKDSECISDVLKILENADNDINLRDKDDWSAIMYAIAFEYNTDLVKHMLDLGAEFTQEDFDEIGENVDLECLSDGVRELLVNQLQKQKESIAL
jgi:ankyrin repeat protein